MKKFVELAQGFSPNFWIVHHGVVPLAVQWHDSREQIVLPSSGGFQTLALEEFHGSSLAGHLDTRKTLDCYINKYGGQKCTLLLYNFANNVVHVHLQKIALNMPTENCNHCLYHLHDSIHTPLTLSLTYLLYGGSTVSSLSSIISLSFHALYPVPWGKTDCHLHKLQNYCLRTLLGFFECQTSLFIIVIPDLRLILGVNYGIFLALKLVPLLHFTLKVMGKVSTSITNSNKSYVYIFTINLCQYS